MAEPSRTLSPHFRSDTTVHTYEEVMLPRIFEPWAQLLLDAVRPAAGSAILDVATGPGTVAWLAAKRVGPSGRVTGVDSSPAMLAVARARQTQAGMAPIEYVEASADSVPLPDAGYDVALCQQGLQHMSDPTGALREMYRVLKAGGRLGLAAWTESPFGLFRRILADKIGGGDHPSAFGSDRQELGDILHDLGFQHVAVETRRLTVILEGGIAQGLRVAEATSVGPVLAAQPATDREVVLETIRRGLEPYLHGGELHLDTAANIAVADRRAFRGEIDG